MVSRVVPLLLSLALLIGTATLSGCGFHLRTWELDSSIASVHVATKGRSAISDPLERALRQAGISVADSAQAADVTVNLLSERRTQRAVAVTEDQARAAEYEAVLGVQYAIGRRSEDGSADRLLQDAQWISARRIYRVDRVNIIGNSEERSLLEREMVNDLVQQLIRRLDAVTRESAVAG